MAGAVMPQSKPHELAHKLLIELLSLVELSCLAMKLMIPGTSSRFLFNGMLMFLTLLSMLEMSGFDWPFRIETQKFMLERADPVKRIIEVGPSKTLSTMAKKSTNGRFTERDKSRSIERSFLSSTSDAKAIFYEYDEHPDAPALAEPVSLQASPLPDTAVQPSTTSSAVTLGAIESPPAVQSEPVPDAPFPVLDVITAITSQKVKQSFDELSLDKSLRDLSGGKRIQQPD